METESPLKKELRDLRKDAGATKDRIRSRRHLMQALDAATGAGALEKLKASIERLESPQVKVEALLVAYGIDMDPPGILKTRRSGYALRIGKTTETVENYENDAIDELEAVLESPVDDGRRFFSLMGHARGRHLISVRLGVATQAADPRDFDKHSLSDYANDAVLRGNLDDPDYRSAPALISTFPEGIKAQLVSAVMVATTFEGDRPRDVWGACGVGLLGALMAEERVKCHALEHENTTFVVGFTRDEERFALTWPLLYFGLFWEW